MARLVGGRQRRARVVRDLSGNTWDAANGKGDGSVAGDEGDGGGWPESRDCWMVRRGSREPMIDIMWPIS